MIQGPDVVAAGAGDVPIQALISGEVRSNLLVIDADGDGTNITDAILDGLRDYGIIPVTVKELGEFDNA